MVPFIKVRHHRSQGFPESQFITLNPLTLRLGSSAVGGLPSLRVTLVSIGDTSHPERRRLLLAPKSKGGKINIRVQLEPKMCKLGYYSLYCLRSRNAVSSISTNSLLPAGLPAFAHGFFTS
jgi:hypothetical protein